MSNYPHQPAWISAATAATELRERAFLRTVYGWMAGGLGITAAAAAWVVLSPAMQQLVVFSPLRVVLLLAELGIVVLLGFRVQRMTAGAAASWFLVYSLLNGFTLSAFFFYYTTGSIVRAFVTASAMFAVMSVYGLVTRRDLSSWGSFFMMGLFGLIIAGFINLFLRSDGLSWAVSLIGVFVFLGLAAYDNQKMKVLARAGAGENIAIIGALNLYLDFINLFIFLLRLFGGSSRR